MANMQSTIEECLKYVDNSYFDLVVYAARRAKMLSDGAESVIKFSKVNGCSYEVAALKEIAAGKVDMDRILKTFKSDDSYVSSVLKKNSKQAKVAKELLNGQSYQDYDIQDIDFDDFDNF